MQTKSNDASVGSKLKGLATTLGLMAVTGLIGYGVAWWQGSQQLAVLEQSKLELVKGRDLAVTQANDARVGTALMKASTELYGIATELADRNFGTAQKRLKTTQDTFAAIEASGSNRDKIEALKKDIAAIEINFVTNPDDQKKRLMVLADQIKQLVP